MTKATTMTTPNAQALAGAFVEDFGAHLMVVTQGGQVVSDFDPRIDRMVTELAEFCDDAALEELATTARTIIGTLIAAVEASGGGGIVRRKAILIDGPLVLAMAESAVAMGMAAGPLRAAIEAAEAAVAAAETKLAQGQADLDEAIVAADVERVLALRVLVQVTGPADVAAALAGKYDAQIALAEVPMEPLGARERDARAASVKANETVAGLEAELAAARDDAITKGQAAMGAEQAVATVAARVDRLRSEREARAVDAARERTAAMRRLAGEPEVSAVDRAATDLEAAELARRTAIEAGSAHHRVEPLSAFVAEPS